jgi:ribosomal-protein-alanine N-acetyltransferase
MEIKDVFGNLPTLETARLLLRKMNHDDAQDLFEYASDPEVAKYTTWSTHQSLQDSRDFLRSVMEQYEMQTVASWGIVHKGNSRFIGTCGFISWSPHHARGEVAYALSRKYWGQGLMTEAVRTVIAFGFCTMQLNRVQAICEVENVASARVMEKVGMTFEGKLREYMFFKEHYRNLKMYSILRGEWDARLSQ